MVCAPQEPEPPSTRQGSRGLGAGRVLADPRSLGSRQAQEECDSLPVCCLCPHVWRVGDLGWERAATAGGGFSACGFGFGAGA